MSDNVNIAGTRDTSCLPYCDMATLYATGGGDRMADGGAKPDRSRNAADSVQWKFGVSNITKHLKRARSKKLKECSVF